MGGFWFVYPFALGIGLVFFSWFACWPCMWGLVNVGGLCVVVVSFPSFWGGKTFALFPVFPSFGGACPAGFGLWWFLFQADAHFLCFRGSAVRFSFFLGAFGFLYCSWLFVRLCPFGNKFLLVPKKKRSSLFEPLI